MHRINPLSALCGVAGLLSLAVLVGCEAKKNEPAPKPGGAKSAANTPSISAGASEKYAVKVTSEASFEADVLKSEQVVLVDFWAPWCGPCKLIAPTIEEIAEEFEGQAVVAKLDVDTAPGIASKYEIKGIPALLFFKNGEVVDTIVGVQPKEQIVAKLKSVMGN